MYRCLTVVIHCRGDMTLHFKLLDALSKICPADHPIHWHCFSGIPQIYRLATSKFSNIVFGVTPFLFSKPVMEKFVQQGITNLVLESDSPFIKYQDMRGDPFVVNFLANRISTLLSIPLKEVCRVTTENVKRVYRI